VKFGLQKIHSKAKKTVASLLKMNSINWPAPNVWVFMAQLVEHCSMNAEATGLNAIKAQKTFSWA